MALGVMAKQGAILFAALLEEAGNVEQFDLPDGKRSFFLHAYNGEAGGAEHVGVEGGLAVVVVLLDGGTEAGVVAGAGGFEVDQAHLADAGADVEQVGANFYLHAGGRVGGGVRELGLAAKEQVAAVALAAHGGGEGFD